MSNDSGTPLNTPVLEGGLERIPFFNGRVLTAEDLQTEQKGNAEERRRLGRGFGTGVLEGLSVRRGSGDVPTTVVVESGLGLAPSGRTVELPRRTIVSVVSEAKRTQTAGGTGQFEDCSTQNATVTSGTGAYVLVLEPASDTHGRVPRTRLGDNGAAGGCGAQYRREGARLQLVPVNFVEEQSGGTSLADEVERLAGTVQSAREDGEPPARETTSMLRNLWAHVLQGESTSSLDSVGTGRRIRTFGNGAVGDDAVPLALIYWAVDRIEFVDPWAVRTVVRPPTDTERVTARSGRRLERLLQFVDHLREVIATHPNPRQIRLDDFVRFVPAAALVPAFDLDSPRGVDPTRFLQPYSRGTVGEKRPGPLSLLLHQSLSAPPLDLAARPNLLRFREKAASDTKPSSLFHRSPLIFVHRDLGVSSTADGATTVLETARSVYQSILRSRVFEPGTLASLEDVIARTSIREPLRDVLERAGQSATLTASGTDVTGTLEALRTVYEEQIRLVERFQKPIDGIEEEAPRQRFAGDVEVRLRPAEGSNISPTLKTALANGDLVAAIDAQAAINEYVGKWMGDTIATGPTSLRHVGSPEGDKLVPPGTEDAPSTFHYEFDLENGTDQRLQFQLSAQATAPTGDWTDSTTVRDPDGNEVMRVTLDSASTETLTVGVSPPQGATTGETATLTIRAKVPAPNDRTMEETLELPIEESTGSPTSHIIKLSNLVVLNRDTLQPYDLPSAPPTTLEIPASDLISIHTDASFTASADPTTADFDVTAALTIPSDVAGSLDEWPLSLYEGTTQLDSTTAGEAAGVVSLRDGQTVKLKIDMNVPDEVSREVIVTLRIESSNLQISDEMGELRLKTVSS